MWITQHVLILSIKMQTLDSMVDIFTRFLGIKQRSLVTGNTSTFEEFIKEVNVQ